MSTVGYKKLFSHTHTTLGLILLILVPTSEVDSCWHHQRKVERQVRVLTFFAEDMRMCLFSSSCLMAASGHQRSLENTLLFLFLLSQFPHNRQSNIWHRFKDHRHRHTCLFHYVTTGHTHLWFL